MERVVLVDLGGLVVAEVERLCGRTRLALVTLLNSGGPRSVVKGGQTLNASASTLRLRTLGLPS